MSVHLPSSRDDRPRRGGQRGTTLVEALIAFVLLALGALAAAQLQGRLRLHGDIARQRSEAVRLADRALERLRAFPALAAASGASSYDEIASGQADVSAEAGLALNTGFHVATTVTEEVPDRAKNVFVEVAWLDRSGAVQRVALGSVVARNDPAYSGSLGLGAGAGLPAGAFARHRSIPFEAKRLGDGRSGWKPLDAGTLAYVFDEKTGDIAERCVVAAGLVTAGLDATALGGCETFAARLLGGNVRFSEATPPTATLANAAPPALVVGLSLSGGSYPAPAACTSRASKAVRTSVAEASASLPSPSTRRPRLPVCLPGKTRAIASSPIAASWPPAPTASGPVA